MHMERMLETLPLMGRGMAGVFAVTAGIIAMMYLLKRIGGRR